MDLNRWTSIVCSGGNCIIDWHKEGDAYIGVAIVQSCQAHTDFADTPQQRLERCLEESNRAMVLLRKVNETFLGNVEQVEVRAPITVGRAELEVGGLDEGVIEEMATPETESRLRRTHGFYWGFSHDRERRLFVRLRGFNPNEKTQAQAIADADFGPGKVTIK